MYGIVMYLMPSILAEIVNANDVLVGDLSGEQQLLLEAALDILRDDRIAE
jgi:hypothetical protein